MENISLQLYAAYCAGAFEEYQNYLMHYGTPRHSGRYPWGSGDDPYQHTYSISGRATELMKAGMSAKEVSKVLGVDGSSNPYKKSIELVAKYNDLKNSGKTEKEIAEELGFTSTYALRPALSMANYERKLYLYERVKSMQADGTSNGKIAEELGLANESSVRSLVKTFESGKIKEARNTADALKELIKEKGYLAVGSGVELELGISETRLQTALEILKQEGYPVYNVRVDQSAKTSNKTTIPILCPQDAEYKDAYKARDEGRINSVMDYTSLDDGKTFVSRAMLYPESLSSDRVMIRYAEDGGIDKDGNVEIRRGCQDLYLGDGVHYAQVRILVDGTHYIKGMATYSDDLPDGVDIVFNTNKKTGTPMCGDDKNNTVLKKIKTEDPDNPFGSNIERSGQVTYIDADGNEKLSPINKTRWEGQWNEWSKELPSQFLAKQPTKLVRQQLDLTIEDKNSQLDEIMSCINPTVKKSLLKDFADGCDAQSVSLKAVSLPRQLYQVILPLTTVKDDEIYAPNFKDGEEVALIRYPHAGTFEIPILKVNNNNSEAKKHIGTNALDAVGISSKVAERLSGADFDGDTVMVIPNNSKNKILSTKALDGLKNFDPKMEYPYVEGMTVMTKGETQKQMGIVSNLITDMTIKGADLDEMARAVRHSMVVIDAEKHRLNYKQSEKDNNIAELKEKYQEHYDLDGNLKKSGASTLLSRAKNEVYITKRKGSGYIDPETGKMIYKEDPNATYTKEKVNKRTGEVTTVTKVRQEKKAQMELVDDAHVLSTGTPVEELYADYANQLKALANQSRLAIKQAGRQTVNKEAKQTYKAEVADLEEQLTKAKLNAPREKQAELLAYSRAQAKKADSPDMTDEQYSKIHNQELVKARAEVKAQRSTVNISDKQWQAIQEGAITENVLTQVLRYADPDRVKQLAIPRTSTGLTSSQKARISRFANNGYSNSQIAEALGISVSSVQKYLADSVSPNTNESNAA